MEDGGGSLFNFVTKAHNLIQTGSIEISEWHKTVKVIFKQMIECIKYIHSKGVCHYDISLENWLINDVGVDVEQTDDGTTKASLRNKREWPTDYTSFSSALYFTPVVERNRYRKGAKITRVFCAR